MTLLSSVDSLPIVRDPILNSMFSDLAAAPAIYQPSKFWVHYLNKNIQEIEEQGLENFKQTINRNYFNWTGWELEEHRQAITHELDFLTKKLAKWCAKLSKDIGSRPLDLDQYYWIRYREYVALLWEFTLRRDKLKILRKLSEPFLGNAFTFKYRGMAISQDICNSVLELNSLAEGLGDKLPSSNILELGGGYGRTADVLLRSFPKVSMTMVDIPPALHVCQWYLSKLHPNRKIFKYRSFKSYEQIRDEFEQSSIRFLLPHQLELIPNDSFNACVNISSLHEMTAAQIDHWFNMIDRLVAGCFYTKQWIKSVNDFDNIIVDREYYPIKADWTELYNRVCQVQQNFFEATYLTR